MLCSKSCFGIASLLLDRLEWSKLVTASLGGFFRVFGTEDDDFLKRNVRAIPS